MANQPCNTMHPEVDVFISNYTLVDPDVYQLWVDGCSSQEAVNALDAKGVTKQTGATRELLTSDVLDHYRTYSLLERLLYNPPKLEEQLAFQIEPQTKRLLIEKYYDFDDEVIRELLGKKLSSRHRKDLDEVSEKTGKSLKSCRRQFDNVKRVFKTVEEMPGPLVRNIQKHFLLHEETAKRYAAVVFIGLARFETGKRKLQHLVLSDFEHCAHAIMGSWTYRDPGTEHDHTDLDREFLLDLRELRCLQDKEKEHKHLVLMRLKPVLLERSLNELESSFRSYSRALVGIAAGLHRTREVRCLFVELVERCLEPWRQAGWPHQDLRSFLNAYTTSALEMDIFREPELKAAWERYMSVIISCLLRMYHT
ncbi:acidic fibroblast growth factor intracellular-binding protein [Schistocerca piceifrons]|uniref:acidic fibroblast growth factor intracellular-binding protein n=1 Tax=Schistocerca piceifrons TaxID=274613 RepID=UPI001F5F7DA7|nr:acidic fibroblast growth factor intracellular-binding protein [Schistocerca piceifrons]XP_049766902.1 acidic fibroblast growth factor intracellular-binding protein [Schistocerca cancellata]XP_049793227.1 acidic fibroblast growth factor intracellular-binding protein [Schistocerca nitens]XP_049840288.1 acidic fibroblast growth factor intracellular-binding protein [Schistocerca gregaria]XP_049942433.1 acidic fibroblast growth factor intracellular-binding protein [Schistocerca serialis cubense]